MARSGLCGGCTLLQTWDSAYFGMCLFFISETKDFIMNEEIPHVDNDVLKVSDIKQELTKLLNSFKNKEVIIDYNNKDERDLFFFIGENYEGLELKKLTITYDSATEDLSICLPNFFRNSILVYNYKLEITPAEEIINEKNAEKIVKEIGDRLKHLN